jgi:hypothetical protein
MPLRISDISGSWELAQAVSRKSESVMPHTELSLRIERVVVDAIMAASRHSQTARQAPCNAIHTISISE